MIPSVDRLKNANDVVDAFNVDPLYLKHDRQGQAPDYRVAIACTLLKLRTNFALTRCRTALADSPRQAFPFIETLVCNALLRGRGPASSHPSANPAS